MYKPLIMSEKRLSLEKKMGLNSIYLQTPLRCMLYAYISAQREITDISISEASRNFMRFIGIDGDEWVCAVQFTQIAKKFKQEVKAYDREAIEKMFREQALTIIGLNKVVKDLDAEKTISEVLGEMDYDTLHKMRYQIEMAIKKTT